MHYTVEAESYEKSWAYLTCEALDAECHTQAWSGKGMVTNCCGGDSLMSDVWRRTLATVGSSDVWNDHHGTFPGNLWRFESWKADALVVNLGTNDILTERTDKVRRAHI